MATGMIIPPYVSQNEEGDLPAMVVVATAMMMTMMTTGMTAHMVPAAVIVPSATIDQDLHGGPPITTMNHGLHRRFLIPRWKGR